MDFMKYAWLIFLFACTKTEPIKQRWAAVYGHDTLQVNRAFFCFPSDSIRIDTITLVVGKYDPNEFSEKPGSIYFPDPVNGDRNYWKLLTQIQ
jgi:hypothetical protein